MKRLFYVTGLGLVCLTVSFAQESGGGFTFDLGYGFTTPVGNTGRHVDEGWNFQGGFGYNFSPWIGAKVDLGYNSFALNGATVGNLGVPGGSLNVFSATLDPVVHLNPNGRFDFYVTGGGGVFHQHQDFSQPNSTVITPGYDPYLGFYSVGAHTSQIGPYSVSKPGFDIGAGFEAGTRFHGKLFAEAKYERVFTGVYHTDYLPVTVGFRWK